MGYEFQANDHRTRLQWVNAFKVAIENAEEPVRYQRSLLDKRKLARQEEKEREEEEDNRKASHADSLDQTKIQLEQEIQARVLEEEWGRREALEKLQEEQRMMLEEERRK